MNERYPAIYRDKHGEEKTTIHNNGKWLSIVVRGVTFTGDDFDFLAASEAADSSQLASFTFAAGYLCDFEMVWDMPLNIVARNEALLARLYVHLTVGPPLANGGVSDESVQLRLDFEGRVYLSRGHFSYFEDALTELQKLLPEDVYLRCCFGCAFSDYHPAGNGLFGDMLCFRGNKQAYVQVMGKMDLIRILPTVTEKVQETYLCSEFEKRIPGAGYRG